MAGPLVFILPPFKTKAPCISISASSSVTTAVTLPVGGQQVRIVNEGPNAAFLCFSNKGTAATLPVSGMTTTCDAVLAGEDIILSLDPTDLFVSAICRATATAVITIYVGNGQ